MRRLLPALLPLLAGCPAFHQGPMPGEPDDATWMQVGEARVRYLDTGGDGPAVVLLHGFASSLDAWDGLVPKLKTAHRVVACDLKGFGWTDRPPGDYSPQAQADLVFALLDRLGVGRAALAGHSWGASVALAMALSRPERVTRLALYDAWVYEEQLPTTFLWARTPVVGEALFSLFYPERRDDKLSLAFYDERLVTEDLIEAVDRAFERPGTVRAALEAVRGQRYAEAQDRYGEVRQPVLLLWGEEDVVSPPWVGQRLSNTLPDARLRVFPRCGHLPMVEAAAPSDAAVVAFFAEDRS